MELALRFAALTNKGNRVESPTMPDNKTNVCGVRITTWGTDPAGGNGIAKFLDLEFFGGNTGHAAVTVTFPADEKGKALIKKYCTEPAIPFEKHLIRVPVAKKNVNPNNPKQFAATDEVLAEEEVYVVNFSWWPRASGVGFALAPFENDDNLDEREGVHVNYSPKWQALLQPEIRMHRGRFGVQKMQYGVDSIVHTTSLTAQQIALFDTTVELQAIHRQLESIMVLKNKLESKKSKLKALKKREKNIQSKSTVLQKNHIKLQTLAALKNCLIKNQSPLEGLTSEQQIQLDKAYPDWRENPSISEVEKKEKSLKKKIKKITGDTSKKVKIARATLAKFSSSEEILLDRFVSHWHKKMVDNKITSKLIKKLLLHVTEEQARLKTKKAELEAQQTKLECELLSPNVQDFLLEHKMQKNLMELQAFLVAQTPLKGGGNYFLGEEFIKKMEQFEVLTGIKWREELVETVLNQFMYMRDSGMQHCLEILSQKIVALQAGIEVRLKQDVECRHKLNEMRYEAWYEIYDSLWQYIDPRSARYLKSEDTLITPPYLKRELDEAFKFSAKKWYGPEGMVEKPEKLTYAEVAKLYAYTRKKMLKAKNQLVDEQQSLGLFKQGDFAHFLTRGRPPDMEVRLPLGKASGASNAVTEGMDVEAMLKEMQRITQEEKFNLHINNCSSTVSKILEAGATTSHLKHQFRNRALGIITNPQMVANNGVDYLKALKKPKDTWFKRIRRFSPLEKLGAWCLKKLIVEKNVSIHTKMAAGMLAVPMGIYAGIKTLIVRMTDPLSFFNDLSRFANYANQHKSTGFKIIAALGYIPGMLVSAPFAAVQYSVTQVVKGFTGFVNRIMGKKKVVHPPEYADLSPIQLKELEQKQAVFNQVSKEMLTRIHMIEISANTIDEATRQFESQAMKATYAYAKNEFKDDQYPVVALSQATMRLFEKEISRLRRMSNPELQQQAVALEAKYNSYLKSNQFMLLSVNLLIQNAFDDRLNLISRTSEQVEVNTLIDTAVDPAAIYAAAEQARLDAQRNFAESEPTSEANNLTNDAPIIAVVASTKRQGVRQEAFERLKSDTTSLTHSQTESTEPEVTVSDPQSPRTSKY